MRRRGLPGPMRHTTGANVFLRTPSSADLFRIPGHVERYGDEQMRARLQRFDRAVASRGVVGCDHPHVADVVSIAGSLRVRAFDVRREQPALRDLADELDVVVAKCRRILLDTPPHVDWPQVEIVGRAGFAVESVAHTARFELLRTNRKSDAAEPRQSSGGNDLDVVDLRVDNNRSGNRRTADGQIAWPDTRGRGDVDVNGQQVRRL